MSTSIVFTDAIGAATLTNGKPSPGDRLSNFVPDPQPIGDSVNRASDLALMMFKTADQYGCSFDLTQIPVATTGGLRLVEIAARLVYHLLNGGTCAVNTGDVSSSSYATCGLMPGTKPTLRLSDKTNLEYTLSLSLINLAASPVMMVCRYAA